MVGDTERHELHSHAEWCDPRRLDATFGGVMGKYTEQAKLAAVKE
ncbi:transposase, partial [Pseudomonas syringae]